MDGRVEKRIVELTKNGVDDVEEMRRLVEEFVHSFLNDDISLPSDVDIISVMKQTHEEIYKSAFEEQDSASVSQFVILHCARCNTLPLHLCSLIFLLEIRFCGLRLPLRISLEPPRFDSRCNLKIF